MSGSNQLSFGATTVDMVYKTFLEQKLDIADAKVMAAHWLLDNVYSAGRSFGYSRPFPPSEPDCSPPPFQRRFAHADWTDGESVVQAGKTEGGDEGFNARFHKIEEDLDHLGRLAAQAFTCIEGMRASLSQALDEIRAELNRINADIAQLKRGTMTTPVVTGPLVTGPKFLGKGVILDRPAQIWQLESGQVVTLPQITETRTPQAVQPVTRAPGIAEILTEDPAILHDFGNGFTAKDLIEKHGNRLSSDGRPLGELLSSIPPTERFANSDELLGRMTELDASLVKGLGADAQIRENLGQATGSVGAATLDKVQDISPALTRALEAEGVKTIDDMASLDATKLTGIASRQGVALQAGSAGALLARVKTLKRL
ncbi:hypothetical protein [Sabulicella rubraurantiaca]|uniref:hypothetical protein n=1 Tax=Sabulicella rubraurantiaca TaxID=2811429 RepID=UPI001A97AFA9|nr:hypothetical protein [Sabulicella rubraurantiaca]